MSEAEDNCAGLFYLDYPMLSKEFNFDKNEHVNFYQLKPKSNKRVWWVCDKGHEWETSVYHRTLSLSGCPYCSNKKVLAGFNDLATIFPDVASEWDYEAGVNRNLLPSNIGAGSSMKAGFVCSKGHKYVASIRSRGLGSGCSVCHGLVVLEGFNDLLTISPDVALEWDYDAVVNKGITPQTVSNKTSQKVGWLCNRGHKYIQKVSDRTRTDSKKTGCPYCSNRKVLVGFNDIVTVHPDIASEWDYDSDLNSGLLPSMFAGGKHKVGWICTKGHKWVATINNRCSQKQNCPKCSLNQTSRIEKELREHLELEVGESFPSYVFEFFGEKDRRKRLQVDMFGTYNNKKVVVEYDGVYWHQNKIHSDILKTVKLLNAGFYVIRIREKYLNNKLSFLPLHHNNLMQINFDSYLHTSKRKEEVVSEIISWLKPV